MKFIPVLFSALLIIVIANANNNELDKSRLANFKQHIQKQYIKKKVKNIELNIYAKNPILNYFESFFEARENISNSKLLKNKKESTYSLEMIIELKDEVINIKSCHLTDRVHCGWMTINCQDNKENSRNNLTQYTIDGYTTLVYTYDKVKSQLCLEQNSNHTVTMNK